jgi:predicted Kef-type K+ transport protein
MIRLSSPGVCIHFSVADLLAVQRIVLPGAISITAH